PPGHARLHLDYSAVSARLNRFLHLSQQRNESLALIRIEPGQVARSRVLSRAARRFCRGQHARDAQIARDPLEDGLRPGLNAKGLDRLRTRCPVEHAEAERTVRGNT